MDNKNRVNFNLLWRVVEEWYVGCWLSDKPCTLPAKDLMNLVDQMIDAINEQEQAVASPNAWLAGATRISEAVDSLTIANENKRLCELLDAWYNKGRHEDWMPDHPVVVATYEILKDYRDHPRSQ